MRKKKNVIYVRLSDEEYEMFSKKLKSSGLSMQAFVTQAILYGKITSSETVDVLKEKNNYLADIDKQLRGIGTNINQMSHVANTNGELPTNKTLLDVLEEVKKLRSEVSAEWQSTRQLISQQRVMQQ